MTEPTSEPAAPQATGPNEFWRRTPPALFPSMLGFLGLGLVWRAAAGFEPLGVSVNISLGILSLAAVIFLFVLASYLSKLSMRPSVILEDMVSIPGRAGVAAMSLSMLLFAAVMVPLSPTVATAALIFGLAGHSIVALLAILVMARTPQGLVVSPAWHLSFVGFIVACLSAAPLGYEGLARSILGVTVLVSALIFGVSLLQLSRIDTPPPLRPMLAIHLAPLSLFTTTASLLQLPMVALIFGVLAIGLAGVLLSKALYLIKAGFSPVWGAFTFPIAAFASALFALSQQVSVFGWLALVPLALASLLTPVVVVRVLRMWSNGVLAAKTGAAVA